MKLQELVTSKDYMFEKLECISEFPVNTIVNGSPAYIENIDGNLRLYFRDPSFSINTLKFKIKSRDESLVLDLMGRGFSNLCTVIADKAADKDGIRRFYLDVTFFYSSARIGQMDVLVSDGVKESLKKKRMIKDEEKDSDSFYSTLSESFLLSNGMENCFAFTDGYYDLEWSKKNDSEDQNSFDEDEGEDEKNDTTKSGKKAIRIFGKNFALYVRIVEEGSTTRLVAERIEYSTKNRPVMKLGFGKIRFSAESSFVSSTVKQILNESPGYLQLWDKYSALEGEFLLKRAREVGLISFNGENISMDKDGVSVFFPKGCPQLENISRGDILMDKVVPVYIENELISWSEFTAVVQKDRTKGNLFTVVEVRNNNLVLKGDGLPVSPLTMSIQGDKKQIIRREIARKRITNGECANPQLGLVIEGISSDKINSMRKIESIKPLSDFVLEKLFPKNKPTDTQVKAIEIALNTPDIAVIQGPPGTGKTTVIKAIIERLNELSRKRNQEAGMVLVTSLQHDAVYNVIKGMRINDMPVLKIGSRSNAADDSVEKWEMDAAGWCNDVAEAILKKNPNLQESIEQSELKKLYQFYLTSPGDDKAVELLKKARQYVHDNDLGSRIERLIRELSEKKSENAAGLLTLVRRIRGKSKGFADDGADNALALLDVLRSSEIFDEKDPENKEIINTLSEASMITEGSPDTALLKRLRSVRKTLLTRIIPPPFYGVETVRDDVVNIMSEVIMGMNSCDSELDMILREFFHGLKNDSQNVMESVKSYSFVFASTAQQSVSDALYKAKGIDSKQSFPEYDTVIVDEAARVNPGDLMIPMSQAKRRIIIVGDHRQLPHIYNEEIFESLKQDGDTVNENDIKISMFQHLMKSARKLEEADGIPRTITLDRQYRSHPLLGNFVNDCFYKPNGEGFESPKGAEEFFQPIYDKPLVWVNIPTNKQQVRKEKKVGTSRTRECEAVYIAEKIKEYIEREDCRDYTFGVITFYSAQVALIKSKLRQMNLADDPRIHIGSVDSFQGLEFDVVFLSVVRTASQIVFVDDPDEFNRDETQLVEGSEEYKRHSEYIEKIGRKYYGFLTSDNRLCVALSRQKRLLIVVGEKDIFCRDDYKKIAEKCVSSMCKLYQLAQKEGIVLNE